MRLLLTRPPMRLLQGLSHQLQLASNSNLLSVASSVPSSATMPNLRIDVDGKEVKQQKPSAAATPLLAASAQTPAAQLPPQTPAAGQQQQQPPLSADKVAVESMETVQAYAMTLFETILIFALRRSGGWKVR